MTDHGYETGRLNLPFVGIATFAKKPYVADWATLDADVAVMGAPFDFGTQYRPGARFGPRAIREASTLFSFGHAGAYDHEDDVTYLGADVRIVDMGDADIVHTDTVKSHANIRAGVRQRWTRAPCPWCWVGIIRSTSPVSKPLKGAVTSMWCRSTPIWTLSMNATG